ncbi:MAG: two-component sensor histidine kinase [Legionellales bacterium]|nr:two-component sensor histidine kinase [Legionellales bacterium]
MKSSIRRYLLINLLIGITLISLFSTYANYYFDRKAIDNHLDHWLSETTFMFRALLGDDLSQRNLDKLQHNINHITAEDKHLSHKFQIEIWDNKNKLLLHSPDSPQIGLNSTHNGFSNFMVDEEHWRVFRLVNPHTGITIITAEKLNTRLQLGHRIAAYAIAILIISYPFLAILIWLIVGNGLATIRKIAQAISDRKPNYLDPVDLQSIPIEVQPLVDELNTLFNRLSQAFEREKAFSANAAHELRTPLAALKTQAQVALRTHNEEERRAALLKLIRGVDRNTHVIQQLLILSRLVPEAVLNDAAEINLTRITTEVIAELAPEAIDNNIDIELIGDSSPIIMKGIPTALSILLRNLIDNAIRYTQKNGAVQVKLHQYPDRIELCVIDNGPGIPPEARSQVFERFYRVLGTKVPGSGLGLAIVRQIAKLHQATVTLGAPAHQTGLEVKVVFPKNVI